VSVTWGALGNDIDQSEHARAASQPGAPVAHPLHRNRPPGSANKGFPDLAACIVRASSPAANDSRFQIGRPVSFLPASRPRRLMPHVLVEEQAPARRVREKGTKARRRARTIWPTVYVSRRLPAWFFLSGLESEAPPRERRPADTAASGNLSTNWILSPTQRGYTCNT
jgi:hypothetical protein